MFWLFLFDFYEVILILYWVEFTQFIILDLFVIEFFL